MPMNPRLLRPLARRQAPATDPYFANVSLLLHFSGANGSTAFVDSSGNDLEVTRTGDAQISTAASVFGGASGYFDGVGDFVVADSAGLNFASGDDFTIEGWIQWGAGPADGSAIISKGEHGTSGWTLYYYESDLFFGIPYVSNDLNGSFTPSIGQWYALAASRSGGTLRLFVDGQQIAEGANTNTYSSDDPVRIGRSHTPVDFEGYVDEVRITKGVGRYVSNYTPATAQFPDQ